MAIFTNFANYLKCRAYFEDTLGFHTLIPDNSKTPGTLNPDNPNEEYVKENDPYSEYDYKRFGIFASMHNFKIAQNIWFLYGKSLPWKDDEIPPQEKESGLELTTSYDPDQEAEDGCGFLLDPNTVENQQTGALLEFIGMKRLVPIPVNPDGTIITSGEAVNTLRENYKDMIRFLKHKTSDESYSSLSNYEEIEPTVSDLNKEQPNSLKITTFYDYNDFGKRNNKEYNVRQIGMLNLLHMPQGSLNIIKNKTCVFNGIKANEQSPAYNLCEILNITNNSIILTEAEAAALNVHPTVNPDSWDNTDTNENRTFLGILHFYMNSIPNNRITYQTDYYNFVLTFENRKPCVCTCENCLNNT